MGWNCVFNDLQCPHNRIVLYNHKSFFSFSSLPLLNVGMHFSPIILSHKNLKKYFVRGRDSICVEGVFMTILNNEINILHSFLRFIVRSVLWKNLRYSNDQMYATISRSLSMTRDMRETETPESCTQA